jgi:hypothetical protein
MVKSTDTKKPSAKKPAAKKPSAKKSEPPSPDAVTLRTSAVTAERVAAAQKLAKERTDSAMEALFDGALETDEPVRVASLRALEAQINARNNRKKPYDLVPRLRDAMARTAAVGQGLDPAAALHARNCSPSGSLACILMNTLQNEVTTREEVRDALRSLAWSEDLGASTRSARAILVYRGDQEAIERVSHMLADHAVSSAAAMALYTLDPSVAIARAKQQLAAASQGERGTIAQALINNARYYASSAAWYDVLEPLSREFDFCAASFNEWAGSERIRAARGG